MQRGAFLLCSRVMYVSCQCGSLAVNGLRRTGNHISIGRAQCQAKYIRPGKLHRRHSFPVCKDGQRRVYFMIAFTARYEEDIQRIGSGCTRGAIVMLRKKSGFHTHETGYAHLHGSHCFLHRHASASNTSSQNLKTAIHISVADPQKNLCAN